MNARGADPDQPSGHEEGEFCVRSEPNHTGKPRRLYHSPFQTTVLKVKQNRGEGRSGQLYAIYHRLARPELPGSQGKTFKRCIPMQDCLLLMRKIVSFLQYFLSLPGRVFFLWLWKLMWHQYSAPSFGLAPPSRPRSLLLLKQAVGWRRVTHRQPLMICCPSVATADTARGPFPTARSSLGPPAPEAGPSTPACHPLDVLFLASLAQENCSCCSKEQPGRRGTPAGPPAGAQPTRR